MSDQPDDDSELQAIVIKRKLTPWDDGYNQAIDVVKQAIIEGE